MVVEGKDREGEDVEGGFLWRRGEEKHRGIGEEIKEMIRYDYMRLDGMRIEDVGSQSSPPHMTW